MTIIRRMERPNNAVQIIERMKFADTFQAYNLGIKAERDIDGTRIFQPIKLIFVIGQSE